MESANIVSQQGSQGGSQNRGSKRRAGTQLDERDQKSLKAADGSAAPSPARSPAPEPPVEDQGGQ